MNVAESGLPPNVSERMACDVLAICCQQQSKTDPPYGNK